MAEAARQATGAAGSGACPKTGRRRLALWRAGVADRGEDELTVRRRSRLGGKGRRVGSGRCPPPRRLAARGRWGGGTAPPRCRAPAVACAGGRCPVPSSAPTADQRLALTGPRVRRCARGVAPATLRRHRRLRRSARRRSESVESRSTGHPRRDALRAHAQDAWFAGSGRASLCQDGGQQVVGWGRAHAPRALCRGRCGGRAVYGCFLCPLDTSPTPS